MTDRQYRLSVLVARHRGDVVACAAWELGDQPVGTFGRVRIVVGFREGELHLLVLKRADGYVWREDNPGLYQRKGWHAPAWRHV